MTNDTLIKRNYSVLMSVYYKEKAEYLKAALDSIWNQTIHTNDFVLVCDGPLNDELDSLIEYMRTVHPEFHIVRLEKNSGLGNALNIGIKYCKNELIARMDSDDISCPERCEKQLDIFNQNPAIDICSGTILEFHTNTDTITGKRVLPEHSDQICAFSKKRNPFNHPAVMFKKSAVEAAGGYNETYHLFEDYYLWIRMLMAGAIGYNIQEPILYMRSPEDLYMRRGGAAYASDMLMFHKWIRSCGWSTALDYATGALPHAAICILPNFIRKAIYTKLHK